VLLVTVTMKVGDVFHERSSEYYKQTNAKDYAERIFSYWGRTASAPRLVELEKLFWRTCGLVMHHGTAAHFLAVYTTAALDALAPERAAPGAAQWEATEAKLKRTSRCVLDVLTTCGALCAATSPSARAGLALALAAVQKSLGALAGDARMRAVRAVASLLPAGATPTTVRLWVRDATAYMGTFLEELRAGGRWEGFQVLHGAALADLSTALLESNEALARWLSEAEMGG